MRSRTWLTLLLFPFVGLALGQLVGFIFSIKGSTRYSPEWQDIARVGSIAGIILGVVAALLFMAWAVTLNRRLAALKARFPHATVINVRMIGLPDRRMEPQLPLGVAAVRSLGTTNATFVAGPDGIGIWIGHARGEPFVVFPWAVVLSVASDMHEVVVPRLPGQADGVYYWPVLRVRVIVEGVPLDLPFSVARNHRGNGTPNPLDQFALRPIVDDLAALRAAAGWNA